MVEIGVDGCEIVEEGLAVENEVTVDDGEQAVVDGGGDLGSVECVEVLKHGLEHVAIINLRQCVLSNECNLKRQRSNFQHLRLSLLHLIRLLIKLINQ